MDSSHFEGETAKRQVFLYLENNTTFSIQGFFFFKAEQRLFSPGTSPQSYLCVYSESQMKVYEISHQENNQFLLVNHTDFFQQVTSVELLIYQDKYLFLVLFADLKLSLL